MEIINHDLTKEKKLIDWLGYSLINTDSPNKWIILDDNQKEVGYIQYSQVMHVDSKIFAPNYETFIDSPTIIYTCSRDLNDNKNISSINNFSYLLMVKKVNAEADFVEINIGPAPSLSILSKEYGFIHFHISPIYGMNISVKTETDNFEINEVLNYKNFVDDKFKEYAYEITYQQKDAKTHNYEEKKTTREITGKQNPGEENKLRITEETWVGHILKNKWKCVVPGTIEEIASKNQMGIDCFNYFRFLVNQIVPFKDDVISSMLTENDIAYNNLSLFLEGKAEKRLRFK